MKVDNNQKKIQNRSHRALRKPLSDRSNVVQTRIPSSLTKPSKPTLSVSTKEADESSLKHDSSIGSNNADKPCVLPQPSTPPNRKSLADSGAVDRENSGVVTVYCRKRNTETRKDKGKAVSVELPFSCPPVARVRSLGNKVNDKHGDAGLSKTSGASNLKRKKKQRLSLPQDFIDQQKAYFAEIDAFELPEEIVSDSDD
ncbi:hypothetical protein NE237_003829 [Protea cynaroides]|uniref:Sororin C-terminal region domain-containing protein n=1 Tax=Protea cynaroides TaxID=273540 RepID=A0A9Q0KHU3_9MAGN|nr:hypothetical protein NE237_003829 [Protea cynaroides]